MTISRMLKQIHSHPPQHHRPKQEHASPNEWQSPSAASANSIVQLQGVIGNQAVLSLLAQQKLRYEGPSHSGIQRQCSCGGSCPKCQAALEMQQEPVLESSVQLTPDIQRFWDDEEEAGDEEESWWDSASEAASDVGDWVSDSWAGDAVDAVAESAGEFVEDPGGWVGDKTDALGEAVSDTGDWLDGGGDWLKEKASGLLDWGGAGEAIAEGMGGLGELVGSAIDELSSGMSDLNLENLDLDAIGAQAAGQIISQVQGPKLPKVAEAESLIARAKSVIGIPAVVKGIDKDLPPPPSGETLDDTCCPQEEVQSRRAALDPATSNLESALEAFKTAQQQTRNAAETAAKLCMGNMVQGVWAAFLPPPASVMHLSALMFSCINSDGPVKSAITAEEAAYKALDGKMDLLAKALAHYQMCATKFSNCFIGKWGGKYGSTDGEQNGQIADFEP